MTNAMRATVGTHTESKEKKMNKSFDSMISKEVECEILKETEKAYYVSVKYFTESGSASGKEAKMWCPKSCCAVENGRVIRIAQFVLDRWLTEYSDFIRSKGGRVPSVMFSRADKDFIEKRKRDEIEEYKDFRKRVLDALTCDVKPVADYNLQTVGLFARYLGGYLLKYGKPAGKCNELVALGETIGKEFGNRDDIRYDELFRKNPSDADLHNIILKFPNDSITYGCRRRNVDAIRNPKFSVNTLVWQFHEELKRKESRSEFYKAFKKHVMFYDRFVEMSFEVLKDR